MSHDLNHLLQQIEDNDSHVRLSAAGALGEIGESAVEPLSHALGHSKWIVRASAAYALGSIGGSKAINALCCALGDTDTTDPVGSCNVRLSAVYALARIGKPAMEPLCDVLAHGDKEAREMASSALGKIGDLRAVQPLCAALRDSDGDIRACAVYALGEIGPPAVEALCGMLSQKDWKVRACAANALAKIEDPRAVEPLREHLWRIDDPIQRFVSWFLADRINFGDGVRRTTWDCETDSLRRALVKCGAFVNDAEKNKPGYSGTIVVKTGSIIAKFIAAVMLFAALGRHGYDYYTLLRWIACGVCALTAFQASANKKTGWPWIFIIVALVLNPIVPLHLSRENWAFVDIAAAVLLLVSITVLDIRRPRP